LSCGPPLSRPEPA